MDYWTTPLDDYCERLGPGLLAEPLNAISNISFFIASYFAFRLIYQSPHNHRGTLWLSTLLFIIGIGSSLYHSFANQWSLQADTIPIYLFMLSFMFLYGRDIGTKHFHRGISIGVIFSTLFIASVLSFAQLPQHWLNGSIFYMPAWIFMLGLSIYHYLQLHSKTLIYALALFTVSLTFRSIDMDVCQTLPKGTHFIWHLCNGAVLYLAIKSKYENNIHQPQTAML